MGVIARTLHQASMMTPHGLLRFGKSAIRQPRYRVALVKARAGFARHGDRYRQNLLFVAGLPKSGTSWIESMLAAYPGYELIAHPEITEFDYANGGTHRYELPEDFFSRLGNALCVIKIHCHGSENNARILEANGVRCCILYRDLRDAAVSHVAYVKRTPWHPEYPVYRCLDIREGLLYFARTLLPEWRDWIDSWKRWGDPERSLELTYEEMLTDSTQCMRRVAQLFELPAAGLAEIAESRSFDNVKGQGSFFRQGSSGDWVNHFDSHIKSTFKEIIGDALVRWGYEADLRW